jgi:hypothetical protein
MFTRVSMLTEDEKEVCIDRDFSWFRRRHDIPMQQKFAKKKSKQKAAKVTAQHSRNQIVLVLVVVLVLEAFSSECWCSDLCQSLSPQSKNSAFLARVSYFDIVGVVFSRTRTTTSTTTKIFAEMREIPRA